MVCVEAHQVLALDLINKVILTAVALEHDSYCVELLPDELIDSRLGTLDLVKQVLGPSQHVFIAILASMSDSL